MSNKTSYLKKQLTSYDVERMGQNAYLNGKLLMTIGLWGVIGLLLICVISTALGADFVSPLIFDLSSDYEFAYIFVAIGYLAVALGILGIGSYITGIYLFTLGRIAVNTENGGANLVQVAAKAQPQLADDDDSLPEL